MTLIELYYSDTCPDCHQIRAILLELLPESATFKEVNIMSGEGEQRARQLNIMSVPTIAINGEVVLTGRMDREDIKYELDLNLEGV